MSKISRKRHAVVHELVMRRGELSASEIASHVNVSVATVRRDLAALERRGLVERTWGGARIRSTVKYLDPFARSADEQAQAKRAIAATAAGLVEPGSVIGLSGGTTCTELARWIRGKNVTVVTNAVNVAMELYNHGQTKVILTGGRLNSYSYELIGEMATSTLNEVRLDLCFVGSSGITPDFGFSMHDEPEAIVARAFRAVSARTVVVADRSKVGRKTLARFAPLTAVPHLITDRGLDRSWLRALQREGLDVTLADELDPSRESGGTA